MNELGLDAGRTLAWFSQESEEAYVLVRVGEDDARSWRGALRKAIHRCYIADDKLAARAEELEAETGWTAEFSRAQLINSVLPDAGSTMAGDFGEILAFIHQATRAHPKLAFGPKKWRLKQDRTKPAPKSDVVQFVLPYWPLASENDEILCAEAKMKSTAGKTSPIKSAISDCSKDRTSRLSATLEWLKDRALQEPLGETRIAHLDRFIKATDHPAYVKRFRAVAIVCSTLLDEELANAPLEKAPEYTLLVIAVPNLHDVYNSVFEAAKSADIEPSIDS